jgi:cysteine desulfurase
MTTPSRRAPRSQRGRIDFAAADSARLRPEAIVAMRALLDAGVRVGAAAAHAAAREARAEIESARADVATLVGAPPEEIVFTSGGTEALNLAVKGVARARRAASDGALCRIVTSEIEQLAVLHPLATLARDGFEVVYAPVLGSGALDLDAIVGAIDERTALVVTHHANHEIGVVQPIVPLADAARARGVPLVCDATASAGLLPLDAVLRADVVAVTARGFGGPAGVGAARIARGVRLRPEIEGGTQERGLRAGAENLLGIAGMGAAARAARAGLARERARREVLAALLRDGVRASVPGARLTSPERGGLPGHVSAAFRGVDGEALVALLDEEGIAASTGSACAAGAGKPSHVLLAIGVPPAEARGSLRLSLAPDNDEEEVARCLALLPVLVSRLRGLSAALADDLA